MSRFSLLLLCGLLLTPAFAQVFEAKTLAGIGHVKGILVDDPEVRDHQVLRLDDKMDFGYKPDAEPGLFRITLRLKTTTRETGSMHVFVTSGNWNQSPYVLRQEMPDITGEELPDIDTWCEITRLVRFTGPGYWGGVIGGWKGLLIDRISCLKVGEPVMILQMRPSKLLYPLKEAGTINVKLVNTTDTPQTVHLVSRITSGVAEMATGAAMDVTLPAVTKDQRLQQQDIVEVKLPLPPQSEYGHAVSVQVMQKDAVLSEATEYFYTSNRPLQVGQYYGWSFPGDYTCSSAPGHFEAMWRSYFPIAECFFWAPCDNSMQAPDTENWWSGQTLLRLSKKPLQEMIAQGHAQGFSFVSYATRWGFGWRMWEFARKHPDLVEWEIPNGNFQLSYTISHMEIEQREHDDEYKDLGSSGILTAAWGNPDAVAYHVQQLQAAMKMFGWDGFRYDNGSPVIDAVPDVFGRSLPLPGWDHARAIAALRDGPRKVKSGAIYGNNTGWNLDLDSQPHPDDPYTQQTQDGGMIMQEGETNGVFAGKRTFAEEANRYFRAGYNAIRFGGHQYNIINPYFAGSDHYYQVALTLAGACHICYHVNDNVRPLMQLTARHCDLFYGDGLHFCLKPDDLVTVEAPTTVLWHDYVRFRALSPTHRLYLVHLINLPPGERLGETKGRFPDPVNTIRTTWTLPKGWTAGKAWHLTGDGGYQQTTLPATLDNGKVSVTLPRLRRWSIIVLDATGPALPEEPKPTPTTTPKPGGASASLSSAEEIALFQNSPIDAVSPMLRYLPNEATTKPFTLKLVGYKVPESTVVDDAGALDGKALRVGATGLRNSIGYGPGVPGPGLYRLTIHAKTLAAPPQNAVFTGFFSSANNNATPGARYTRTDYKFSAADFPEAGKWVDLNIEGIMTYANYWGGLDGGWDGLLLDKLTFTYVRPLTRAEFTSAVEPGWADNQTLQPHFGVAVWYGAGLYYRQSHLEEVLNLLGAKVTLSKAWRYRGPVGFDTPLPAAKELAGYDLVILVDSEARALSPRQQMCLEGYVQHGGRLLVLGGPYGFGNGGWQDSPFLTDLLPITLHKYDLQFVGKGKPVEIVPTSALAKSVSWKAKPVVFWQHVEDAKPDTTIVATANGKPAIVTWAYGAGRVGVITLTPLGEEPAGATAYWNWPEWPQLMGLLCQSLLAR